jgi:hypothetical protein
MPTVCDETGDLYRNLLVVRARVEHLPRRIRYRWVASEDYEFILDNLDRAIRLASDVNTAMRGVVSRLEPTPDR